MAAFVFQTPSCLASPPSATAPAAAAAFPPKDRLVISPSWRTFAQPPRIGRLSSRQHGNDETGRGSDRTARVGRVRGGGDLKARCLGRRAEGEERADVADKGETAQLEKSLLANQSVAATCINTIRMLVVDAVNAVNAGHPGSAMGLAPLGALLFAEEMRFDPTDPAWPNRDRFILSNGHVCLLQYCLLHLTGYNLQMEGLKRLAKLGSKTPGHPENTLTPGIEVTTGPLGQGFANAVGVAAAEAHLAARLNTVDFPDLIDHHTFVVFGDGCAMEGVVNEAASLAGHWGLGKLIAFYDSNQVTIDGSTDLAFSEDVMGRFDALRWHVQRITLHDAADLEALRTAIQAAKKETHRPSVIQVDTVIGFGSPKKQGTSAAHHGAFGSEETKAIKKELHWPYSEPFTVPEEVYRAMQKAAARGQSVAASWRDRAAQYRQRHPDRAALLDALTLPGRLPAGWEDSLPHFQPSTPPDATRGYSEACLNALVHSLPNLLGGSADLASSNKVAFHGLPDFSRECFEGRNFHYGVREHAMAAISNGLALHSRALIPVAATFLVFSDYMRPALRLAALSAARVLFVFTHDSIGLGEDGPTHQPVEHLPSLRAIPNLHVIRPGDATETAGAYVAAIRRSVGPTAILLSRQKLTAQLRGSCREGVLRGGYVLGGEGREEEEEGEGGEGGLDLILIGSGSELVLCQEAAEKLRQEGYSVRVVSLPCWELFRQQPREYRDAVLPPRVTKRLAVEAARSQSIARIPSSHTPPPTPTRPQPILTPSSSPHPHPILTPSSPHPHPILTPSSPHPHPILTLSSSAHTPSPRPFFPHTLSSVVPLNPRPSSHTSYSTHPFHSISLHSLPHTPLSSPLLPTLPLPHPPCSFPFPALNLARFTQMTYQPGSECIVPCEGQGSEGQGSEGQGSEGQGSEGQGSEGQGREGQGSEGQGSEGQGSEGQGSEGQGSEGQGSEEQGSEGQGSEGQGSEEQGSEEQGSEEQGSEEQGSEEKGSEEQGSEEQGSEEQGSEEQGSEEQGSEEQGSEGQGSEEKGSEGQGSEEQGSEGQGSEEQGSEGQGSEEKGSHGATLKA
ncbi:unnamed protein product [Closterium sp. Naga37s-1]|nr:unnamed protein product [Closterium sp. Naga37s-1]